MWREIALQRRLSVFITDAHAAHIRNTHTCAVQKSFWRFCCRYVNTTTQRNPSWLCVYEHDSCDLKILFLVSVQFSKYLKCVRSTLSDDCVKHLRCFNSNGIKQKNHAYWKQKNHQTHIHAYNRTIRASVTFVISLFNCKIYFSMKQNSK